MTTPRATYRFQFRKGFGFARAEALVDYLAALGISHVYASPITVARSGSPHGYDVVDPTGVNPELGGEDGLRRLVAALRAHGMGLIIDIVPNHMGVAGGENRWWNDVLREGPDSRYARFFDIDWRAPLLLPILGAPLAETIAAGDIRIDRRGNEPMLTAYEEHRLPIRPEDHHRLPADGDEAGLAELLARQHYRLGWWRAANDELGWRRFFTISELAGLRIEDEAVFEATHALYFRLYEEGLIDGVRVDHVDGLTDPAGYCRKLRARLDAIRRPEDAPPGPAYVVVEKILGPGERLGDDWGVDGTSGYDFMEEVSALLHDPAGEAQMLALWHDFSGRALDFAGEELQARRDMLAWSFEAQLSACVEAFHRLAATAPETRGFTTGMLRRAVQRLLWVFPVYRTYGPDAPESDESVREQARVDAARFTPPGEREVADHILAWLAGEGPGDAALAADAVRRLQQLSAPIAAKAVEDTAFYRYGAMLSRTDVGFDAARFAMPVADFHAACEERAAHFPAAMLATATHDHKRGEDVRARLALLSAIPGEWCARVETWDALADGAASGMHPADRYMLYQTLYGAWPVELEPDDAEGLAAYAQRLAAWQEKALREAKLRSSWEAPDGDYEGAARAFVAFLLDPARAARFLADIGAFLDATQAATGANGLVQAAMRCTVPGMPDLYQGCELADFSLVDPDNRRAVDYEARRDLLACDNPPAKMALIRDLLVLRKDDPALFGQGGHLAAAVTGARARHVFAFSRVHEDRALDVAVTLRTGAALLGKLAPVPGADWWADTRIAFATGGEIDAAEAFAYSPVFVRMTTV